MKSEISPETEPGCVPHFDWAREKVIPMPNQQSSHGGEQAIELLMELARYIEPGKHAPGTITMRVPLTNIGKVYSMLESMDLHKALEGFPGYKRHETSVFSRSVTITYDPVLLPYELWQDYCKIKKAPELAASVLERLRKIVDNGGGQGLV
jgi:hypothetical protein